MVWKYSYKDFFLFSVAVLQCILTIIWAVHFLTIPLWVNIFLILPMSLVFYFNPIVITHNFLHTPFFKWNWLNRAFACMNSINLGFPQILYKYHHLLHHRYSNDPVLNGTTNDPSSTFRYGKNGNHESAWTYCILSHFRDPTTFAMREVIRRKKTNVLILQGFVVALAFCFFLFINWKWVIICYVPMFCIGWALAYMENYYEHFRASNPSSRFANSVSYYGNIYNIFMFNEGYHQEHHMFPSKHWTERPHVGSKYTVEMKRDNAFVAKFPPLLGFLDKDDTVISE